MIEALNVDSVCTILTMFHHKHYAATGDNNIIMVKCTTI